jgi:hypothetical protein
MLLSRLVDFDVYIQHVKGPYPHVIGSLNVDFLHYNFAMYTVKAVSQLHNYEIFLHKCIMT